MKLSDFDFDLPEELIALRPAFPRSSSRLLVADESGIQDAIFRDIVDLLEPGDCLVLNNTKVIPARLYGERIRFSDQGETRAKIEVTLLSPEVNGDWLALAKPAKRIRSGERIDFGHALSAELIEKSEHGLILRFNKTGTEFDEAIDLIGNMPLPPYIDAKRKSDSQDKLDYQTVFAKQKGAVAAPTASLHFDELVLTSLKDKGVKLVEVTLHVGAGTFLPVKVDDISDHKMHSEWGHVSAEAAQTISKTKQEGGRIIPVGTTALRLIETAAHSSPEQIVGWTGDTDIFITPGFDFKVTNALITNFHLPKSTLLMLVSALMGKDRMTQIYSHAIEHGYRFFSYGDASLLLANPKNDL